MSGQDDVEKLVIRLAPEPICDDCVADTLKLADRESVPHRTRELAGSNGFIRIRQPCSMCGMEKVVIRKAARPN
jgi:hypothetical protein